MMLPNLGAWTRTEHAVCACPTPRERNECEGQTGLPNIEATFGSFRVQDSRAGTSVSIGASER